MVFRRRGFCCLILLWLTAPLFAADVGKPLRLTTRPALDGPWRNPYMSVRYIAAAQRIEITRHGEEEPLVACVFPTRVEIEDKTLVIPERDVQFERKPTGAGGEMWRFTATVKPADGIPCLYSAEFDLQPNRHWIRRRTRLQLGGSPTRPLLLHRVVLDETDVGGLAASQPSDGWQSYPILSRSYFWGVEFPVGQASVRGRLGQLSYAPGVRVQPGVAYETWPVVYGVAGTGGARQAFEAYLETIRPPTAPVHIQYNSWWSLPFPYTESMLLEQIGVFRREFSDAANGRLDSFCIDLGWSAPQSIWQIDGRNFPQGFRPLSAALRQMGTRLGLWVSPSSCYPQAQDLEWAKANGYETLLNDGGQRVACLGGRKYQEAIRTSLVRMQREYDITHFKFDGYIPTCREKDHGHETGAESAEQIALGLIDIFRALKAGNPNVWIEPTCFGYRPSPWWLMYASTLIGTYGDDAPAGRTPCPIYRESYTTGRDFFNLQGVRDVLLPINAQEVLGVIHQTPEPLQNDAIVTALRGHAFLPLYVNPKFMDARRWQFLAKWTQFVRDRAYLLRNTRAITSGLWRDEAASRDWNSQVGRDVYGYAHFTAEEGLILLRNPWITAQHFDLKLDPAIGCPASLRRALAIVLYPIYGGIDGAWSAGDTLSVDLAPYETRVILLSARVADLPLRAVPPKSALTIGARRQPTPHQRGGSVQLATGDGERQFLILAEGDKLLTPPEVKVSAGGQVLKARFSESGAGWKSSGLPTGRPWCWFEFDLPREAASLEYDLDASEDVQVSGWIVDIDRPAADANTRGPLPPPEMRYLHSQEVFPPARLTFLRPAGEVNVCRLPGVRAIHSSLYAPEYSADKAIDGNAESRWNSNWGDVAGAWIEVQLPAPCRISDLRFHEAAGGRITAYRLQRWDGAAWQDVLRAEKEASRVQVHRRFEAITAQRVRFLIDAATQLPSIYELEMNGVPLASTQAAPR